VLRRDPLLVERVVRRLVLFPFGEKGFVMKNLVLNPMTYVVAGVFGLVSLLGSPELFAQTSNEVTFTPIVDFKDIFTSIIGIVGPLVAGAIGLGLGVWGARYVFSLIKSMGR
jgi:hypothetical protein